MSFWSTCRFLSNFINFYLFSVLKSPEFIIHKTFLKTVLYDWIIFQRKEKMSVYLVVKLPYMTQKSIDYVCVGTLLAVYLSFINSWLLSDFLFKIVYVESNNYKSTCIFAFFFSSLVLSIKDNSQFKNQVIFCSFIRQADEKSGLKKIYLVLWGNSSPKLDRDLKRICFGGKGCHRDI